MNDERSRGALFFGGPMRVVALVLAIAVAVVGFDATCGSSSSGLCGVFRPTLDAANKWQSMLGAVLAVIAAAVSAWFVFEQIHLSDSQEKQRIGRRQLAQRAQMPLVMSRVCDYAEQSAEGLRHALSIAQKYGAVSGDRLEVTEPVLHADVVPSIVSMIEAAAPGEASAYVDLLNELQVHMARWRSFASDMIRQRSRRLAPDIEEELVEAAELYARASNLLAATRPARMAEGAATTRVGGVLLLGLHGQTFDGVRKLAEAYDASSPLVAAARFS